MRYIFFFGAWCIGIVVGYIGVPDNPVLGALIGGNTFSTWLMLLEVHEINDRH